MDRILNKEKKADMEEIEACIENPIFRNFYNSLEEPYQPKITVEKRLGNFSEEFQNLYTSVGEWNHMR